MPVDANTEQRECTNKCIGITRPMTTKLITPKQAVWVADCESFWSTNNNTLNDNCNYNKDKGK